MAKRKTARAYEQELKELIKIRTGEDCTKSQPWLIPQIRAAAATMVIIDKIQDELLLENTLTSLVVGSTGQQKTEVHPLLAQYDKMQRTLMLQYESLGLNFNSAPSKIKETVSNKDEEETPMEKYYKDLAKR